MLTYHSQKATSRKDLPWLLLLMALIWISGTAFFHSPWEPYEPFVFAIVKSIDKNNLWLIPYLSSAPYLDVQPFYFWIYASIIKLLNISDSIQISHAIRIINTVIIILMMLVIGKIGSSLSAYKNGRTTLLILICMVGFINNTYQISPNTIVLLGVCLYIYAIQLHNKLPGVASGILFVGLFFMSINFTCEFITLGLITLIILPVSDKHWRNRKYFYCSVIGTFLFLVVFFMYCYALKSVDNDFFLQWQDKYMYLELRHHFINRAFNTIKLLSWFLIPGWILVIWTFYKRKTAIFKDKTLKLASIFAILLLLYTLLFAANIQEAIFPIVISITLLASVEVDSIRISIVSFFNWFSIFLFGSFGVMLWLTYAIFIVGKPQEFILSVLQFTQDYVFHLSFWRILIAVLISGIWVFMITRSHIKGREMVTNWASGSTCVLILFLTLWLPWFDSILSFRPIVEASLPYIDKNRCVATNPGLESQVAIWYYYTDIYLMPSFLNLNYSICNQAVIATSNINSIDQSQWRIVWGGRRPIDRKVYYVIKHR